MKNTYLEFRYKTFGETFMLFDQVVFICDRPIFLCQNARCGMEFCTLNVDDFEVLPLNNAQKLGFSKINSTTFEISGDFWPKMGLI